MTFGHEGWYSLFARVVKVTGFWLYWLQGLLERWDFFFSSLPILPSSRKAGFWECCGSPTLCSRLGRGRVEGALPSIFSVGPSDSHTDPTAPRQTKGHLAGLT